MPAPHPGAQVVQRISDVLRVVSQFPDGASSASVALRTGLTRPTAHRLLVALAAEGMLEHDRERARWHIGPELFVLGAVAAERHDVASLAHPHVRALADATGESAFLSARRGDETVCLHREEGRFPVRSFVLFEGVRFPLGVASAGLAILAFLEEAEVRRYLAAAELEALWGADHRAEHVLDRVAETTARGYAVNPGLIVEGSWGMAAAVFDRSGAPQWALSLTGIESRFRPDRRDELGELLLSHSHRLTREIAAAG